MKPLGLFLAAMVSVMPGLALAGGGCHGAENAGISCPSGENWDHKTQSCVTIINS